MTTSWNPSYSSTGFDSPKNNFHILMTELTSASSCGSSTSTTPRNSSENLLEGVDGVPKQGDGLDMMSLIPNLWSDPKSLPSQLGARSLHNNSGAFLPTSLSYTSISILQSPPQQQPQALQAPLTSLGSPWNTTSPIHHNGTSSPSVGTSNCSHPTSPLQDSIQLAEDANTAFVKMGLSPRYITQSNNARPKNVIVPSQIASMVQMHPTEQPQQSQQDTIFDPFPLTEENLSLLGQEDRFLVSSTSSVVDASQSTHYTRKSIPRDHKFNGHDGSAKVSRRRDNQLYKTEMCVQFQRHGYCPYGTKCQFAHGQHELKKVKRSDNWKTKPCINWMRTGTCRYGKRCCFKHGDQDNGTQLATETPPKPIMNNNVSMI
ncbi:DEKNAAC102280 [Brettanomyces naardenensis]|uniref:DEKNAAC102280 n=1 Tax=Brettanomyces naardenensis TaxID=13370 RepID=A0A448YKJ1_BRENA|nr:DEKNAAC102280 [Brettanomyces naardenensis]